MFLGAGAGSKKKIPRAGAASKPDGSGQRCMARVLKKEYYKVQIRPFFRIRPKCTDPTGSESRVKAA